MPRGYSTSLFSKYYGELPRGQYVSKISSIEESVIGREARFHKKGKVNRSTRDTCFTEDATTEHPFTQNLSPAAGKTSSHGFKRRRRKLVSDIWEEPSQSMTVECLWKVGVMVVNNFFPGRRDNGTSHLRRHLKVCPMKTTMNEMIDKLGPPEGVDPNWKLDPKVSRFELVKLIVVNCRSLSWSTNHFRTLLLP